ncbi:MAG: tRNA pseudouridine(55) synthase TruB [Nitrospirota bacterium]
MNLVINLNKPHGITSQEAVTDVKKRFKVRKAGHAGTLDPIATGVLLVCLNEATKITGFLSDLDKEYLMTAKLGEATDTYDTEGSITKTVTDFEVTREDVERAARKFIGDIEQTPPMYSAIKVNGTPLYELARKGVVIERKPRSVTISAIEIVRFESPFLTLKVTCSKGTYIRSLCNDIGDDLGVGAHLVELIRTRIGAFTIDNAAAIDELPQKSSALCSVDDALHHLPEIRLEGDTLRKAKNGNPVIIEPGRWGIRETEKAPFIRLKDPDGKLFGIGKIRNNLIKIERLLKR